MRKLRHVRLLVTGLVCLLAVLSLTPTGASSANISHSYNSNDSITAGSLVSLKADQTDYVEAATTYNASKLLGVAVASNDSLLAVDVDQAKVQIATSGTVSVLVSNLNGDIDVGDQVAVSPFEGVGMKAGSGMHVIGLAQTAFVADDENNRTQEITDKQGKTRDIRLGLIRLNIGIGLSSTQTEGGDLNSLQKLAKGITGRTVPTWRAIISVVVAVIALIALITLVYSSIYGSIISIGRNPLAKFAVFRTLGSVLAMATMTAVIAGLTIFLLLR